MQVEGNFFTSFIICQVKIVRLIALKSISTFLLDKIHNFKYNLIADKIRDELRAKV